MTATRERIAIVSDDEGKWYTRHIRLVEHDLALDEKVYRCDTPLGGPFDSLTAAVASVSAALPSAPAGGEWQITDAMVEAAAIATFTATAPGDAALKRTPLGEWPPDRPGLRMDRWREVAREALEAAKAAAPTPPGSLARPAASPLIAAVEADRHALREALVAMSIASAVPSIAAEYDFGPALAAVEARLSPAALKP